MTRIYNITKQWQEQGLLLPIWLEDDKIRLVDQIKLPAVEKIYTLPCITPAGRA